jgi:hypothetical protein
MSKHHFIPCRRATPCSGPEGLESPSWPGSELHIKSRRRLAHKHASHDAYPYAQQWNLDLQQQFRGGTLLDMPYAGAKGTHLGGPVNLNQPPDAYDSLGPQLLTEKPSNPFAGLVLATSFLNSSFTVGQRLRSYPQFSSVSVSNASVFGTFFHSLQVSL